jgi:rhodanese-related sulfurtransferase
MELQSRIASAHAQPVLLSAEEASAHSQKLLILDAQNPKYLTSTVPKAKCLNIDILLRDIPKAQPVLLVCLNGYRSLTVAKQLLRRGYLAVYVLKGGIIGWRQAGFTVQGINKTA